MEQQHLHQPEMDRQEQEVTQEVIPEVMVMHIWEQEVILKTIPEAMEMRRQEQEVTQEVAPEVMKIMNLPMEMEGQVRINVEINLNFFSQVC